MFKTLRTLILFLILSCTLIQTACAISIEEGKDAFQTYVRESNACSVSLINMYDKNSVIKRIVVNKDGSSYTKILPVASYKIMLINFSKAALWQGYSNTWTNVSFHQSGSDVVVKALRHPSTSSEKLPATLVFHRNQKGKIVIKEEAFQTKASFLLK
jgi:hypothetical protein